MVRVYKKKLGAEGKKNYHHEFLQKALRDVRFGKFSMRKGSEQYRMPYATNSNHYHGNRKLNYGGQTALSRKEEDVSSRGEEVEKKFS